MTLRNWLSGLGVAMGALVMAQACGPRSAEKGESCTTTNDCGSNLVCVAQICVDEDAASLGGAGNGPVRSQLGESCEVRVDCEAGLSCIGNRCTKSDTEVVPNGKVCESVQCLTTADCCLPPDSYYCETYKTGCDGGDKYDCNSYAYYCDCNTKNVAQGALGWECTSENVCLFHETCDTYADCSSRGAGDYYCTADGACATCESGADCLSGICSAGRCVECAANDDCSGGDVCKAGSCVSSRECWATSDCNEGEECSSDGKCVTAKCTSDAICVSSWNRLDAVCGDDGACTAPCTEDAQCGVVSAAGGLTLCDAGFCRYVGCESDQECQVLHNGDYGSNAWRCVAP